jgi:putative ABC transport system permease protein
MPRKLSTSMSFGEAVRIATTNLWTHKMRSVLTLLGVVIGVTAVIAVVSLVSGLNRYVADKVVGLGADVFMINRSPSIITDISQWEDAQKRRKFHYDDYLWLRDACRSCVAVGGQLVKRGQVKYGTNDLDDTQVIGFTHEMPEINARELSQGRYHPTR